MAEDDLPDVWEGATPEAERVSGTAPPPPPPTASPPAWMIVAGVVGVLVVAAVLSLVVMRGMGASKSARTQSSASSAATMAASAAASAQTQSSAATSLTPPAQVAANFGLIGVWAVDCSQPPSDNNAWETFAATPEGALSDAINTGPGSQDNYRWDTARPIGADRIGLDGVHLGDNAAFHVIMQKMPDGRLHVLQSSNGSGQQLVVNGAFTNGSGAPLPEAMCSSG